MAETLRPIDRRRREMHALVERAVPDLPQHHRRRVAGDAATSSARVIPLELARGAVRHAGARLDRAARVEHPRRLHRRRQRASAWSTSARSQPARRQLQRARARADVARRAAAAPAHAARPARSGSRTAPRTTTRPGASACRQRQLDALPDGEYEVCIDSTLAPGHLTYGELVAAGRDRGRDPDLHPRLPPVAVPTTT